jgi:hypothetical protein
MSLFGQAAKQTGVQRASLSMGFRELLIGCKADAAMFAVHVHFPAVRLGTCWGPRNVLGLFDNSSISHSVRPAFAQ